MNSERLLERKAKLSEELAKIGQEIEQTGKDITKKGFEDFVQTGELAKQDGFRLQKLRDKHQYFLNIGTKLNDEIGTARKQERLVKLGEVDRTLVRLNSKHQKLNEQGHDLKLKIQGLAGQAREINAKVLEVEQVRSGFKRVDITETMKFNKAKTEVDEFVAKFYVADIQGLRELVRKTRRGNKALLPPYEGAVPIEQKRMDVHVGFAITLDKDTGKILKRKGIERSLSLTWTKEMIEEVV